MPSSAALNGFSRFGFSVALIGLPPSVVSHEVRGGNLFQCEETQVRLSMPIRNRFSPPQKIQKIGTDQNGATSVTKRKRRLQPLPAMASQTSAKAGAFAYWTTRS